MCTMGAAASVEKLLDDLGASVNYENAAGWTPLQAACFSGHHEVATLLLSRGADVNSGNGGALKAACRQGHLNVVELLLRAGATADLLALTECGTNAACAALVKAAIPMSLVPLQCAVCS